MDTGPELIWNAVLEQHPVAHLVYDLATLQVGQANAAACARYGHPHAALCTLDRLALLQPEHHALLRQFVEGLPTRAPDADNPVWRERHRDGHLMLADIRGMAVRWQGRPARLIAVTDATSRDHFARQAREGAELLDVAGRVARLGGWSLDAVTRRLHYSPLVAQLHGHEGVLETTLAQALSEHPPDAALQLHEAIVACLEQGLPFDLELPLRGPAATAEWLRIAGEPVRDGSGVLVGVRGAQQDITSARHNAMALNESRARLQALVAAIPDLWMVFDAQLRYLEVSDPLHPALSAPWAQKVGRPIGETVEAALAEEMAVLVHRAHARQQPQEHRYTLRVLDGRTRAFEARFAPMSGGRTLALIRDVTERALLEQRFERMADAAPIGIFMTDADGGCTYTNAAWQALYGLRADEALGQGWARGLAAADRGRVAAHWQATAAAGQPFELEFTVQPPEGPPRLIWAQARPLRSDDGRVRGHVGVSVDVTQVRELEAARQARAVAEEAGRRQQAFMSRMSHELRTPLNAILGFGELLLQGPVAAAQLQAYLGHIVDAGRHMLALVDDLLELQRIEQGRLELRPAPVDVVALLDGCLQMLAPLAARHACALQRQGDAAVVLTTDERALRQIVLNLGSNALKYGGRGGVVALHVQATPDGGLTLHVSDRGPGLTPEQLERLFQPFERLGQERAGIAGSGLGLVITRQLAQALGGTLVLRSTPGQGTVAELRLPPRCTPEAAPAAESGPAHP